MSTKKSTTKIPERKKRAAKLTKAKLTHEAAQKKAVQHTSRVVRSLNKDLKGMGIHEFQVKEVTFSGCPPPCVRVPITVGGVTINVCKGPDGGPCNGGQ